MTRITPRVFGLDFSLTSPGVAFSSPLKARSFQPEGKGHPRLEQICRAVEQHARGHHLAVVESASYGSVSSTYHQLAGGWHLATHALWRVGVPYATVAPSTLKKFATGDGHATKDQMVQAARHYWPKVMALYARKGADDTADALFCAALGSLYLGRPLFPTPYPDAVRVVDWPRVGAKPATPKKSARKNKPGARANSAPARKART